MEIIVIILLTFLNGFFAMAEISLVSVKKTRIDQLASSGNFRAKIVQELLKKPESFLSAVQVGITLIGIISGAYGGIILTDDMVFILRQFTFLGDYLHIVSLVIVIGSITFFTIIVGELVPKTIAFKYSERLALFSAPIIKYFSIIVFPMVKTLTFTTKFILKICGIKGSESDHLSEDELKFLLNTAGKQGVLEMEESQVHQNLFYFTDQTAESLMTKKSDVEWIDIDASVGSILSQLTSSVHSKFIVGDKKVDKIVGIITAKEFLEHYQDKNFKLSAILQKPIYIKGATSSFKILNQFKNKKQYLAVVKNEEDDFIGIITLHDLIEAIIGYLPEYDDQSLNIVLRSDGTYLINGKTTIFEFNQHFQSEIIKVETPHISSLEDFILKSLKSQPTTGTIVNFEKYIFEILDMDGVKIDKLLFKENSNPIKTTT